MNEEGSVQTTKKKSENAKSQHMKQETIDEDDEDINFGFNKESEEDEGDQQINIT